MTKTTPYEYAQFASLTYLDPNTKEADSNINIPLGWEMIEFNQKNPFIGGYWGTAFKKDNHIVISHRGTSSIKSPNIDDLEITELVDVLDDYISDLQLWLNKKPQQFIAAQKFTEDIMKKFPNYEISFTGHSLGGFLAQLSAAHHKKEATVFDSPGAKELIEKIIKSEPKEIIIFNSQPNIINSANIHYTSPFLLKNIFICPEKPSLKEFIFLTTKFHSMTNILQQFNTSDSLTTYSKKIDHWPNGVKGAYNFFISYDLNKPLWDYCISKKWESNLGQGKQSTNLEEFQKSYIANKLYSPSQDPINFLKKITKEIKDYQQNKFNPENSVILKLFENDLGENIFNIKSITKSIKHNIINKGLDFFGTFYHTIETKYDELIGHHNEEHETL